eukprot:scaffold37880_cov70-Phaeocystis_antarctica.AAC.2
MIQRWSSARRRCIGQPLSNGGGVSSGGEGGCPRPLRRLLAITTAGVTSASAQLITTLSTAPSATSFTPRRHARWVS